MNEESQDSDPSLERAIEIHIPAKCTHCNVRISREWVICPPSGWVRRKTEVPHTGPGRHLHLFPGNFHVTREMCREAVMTLLRGDPILCDDSGELRKVFVDVASFFTLPTNLRHVSVNSFTKQYLEFLCSVVSLPKQCQRSKHTMFSTTVSEDISKYDLGDVDTVSTLKPFSTMGLSIR
jgi:hypothetical protein